MKFIPVSEPSITQNEIASVVKALKSGWVSSLGEYIIQFEQRFAQYIGTRYALTTSNGTTALHLALQVLGLRQGDEVIVPDMTFVATANAVSYTGAKPVFVDIDPETWCIDPQSVQKAITSRTKAIIPVHIYGHPAHMDQLLKIAHRHHLYVIEDCAEAHGAEYQRKRVGGLADMGVFSFYGNKIITTGEGGMIVTNNLQFYKKAKFLKDQAMSDHRRYWHTNIGYNYRMTNVQAALGLAQLRRIRTFIQKKRMIFQWYKKWLGDFEGIKLNSEQNGSQNVYWMVCLVLEKNFWISRDQLMRKLKAKGIDTRPFFYPISQMKMYNKKSKPINSIARSISQRGMNLPCSVNLNEQQVMFICQKIKEILTKASRRKP